MNDPPFGGFPPLLPFIYPGKIEILQAECYPVASLTRGAVARLSLAFFFLPRCLLVR